MNEELMSWVLDSMRGARLREIAFGEAAIRLEFSKSGAFSWEVFRLKTANFLSFSKPPSDDYEAEIQTAMPGLYRALGLTLSDISCSGFEARLSFDDGPTLFIQDKERIWDNLFSVELENKDGRSEYLYGGHSERAG